MSVGNLETGCGKNYRGCLQANNLGLGHFLSCFPKLSKFFNFMNPTVMFFRNDKSMAFNYRRNIQKPQKMFIFKNLITRDFSGNDLAKNTVRFHESNGSDETNVTNK